MPELNPEIWIALFVALVCFGGWSVCCFILGSYYEEWKMSRRMQRIAEAAGYKLSDGSNEVKS